MKKILFLIILISAGFAWSKVNAQTPENYQVYPAVVEEKLSLGETKEIKINILFNGSEAIRVSPIIKPITKDYNNEKIIVLDDSQINISTFFEYSTDRITINPNEAKEFNIKVNYIDQVESATYAFAVFFNESGFGSEGQRNETSILRSIATVLLITIDNGDLDEEAVVTKFKPEQQIFFENDYDFELKIKNEGPSYIKPIGVVSVGRVLGIGEDLLNEDFNNNLLGIFSNTEREFAIDLSSDKFTMGKYKAEVAFAYGNTNKVITKSTTFWVFPWYVVVLAILIVVYICYKIGRRFKNMNYQDVMVRHPA